MRDQNMSGIVFVGAYNPYDQINDEDRIRAKEINSLLRSYFWGELKTEAAYCGRYKSDRELAKIIGGGNLVLPPRNSSSKKSPKRMENVFDSSRLGRLEDAGASSHSNPPLSIAHKNEDSLSSMLDDITRCFYCSDLHARLSQVGMETADLLTKLMFLRRQVCNVSVVYADPIRLAAASIFFLKKPVDVLNQAIIVGPGDVVIYTKIYEGYPEMEPRSLEKPPQINWSIETLVAFAR